MQNLPHVPVLPAEVLDHLAPAPGEVMVDATVGAGGHARLIAERLGPSGKLLALDQDEEMLKLARAALSGLPVTFEHANFHRLSELLRVWEPAGSNGVLADLGVCSAQLDLAQRGFSFRQLGPLDMRMNPAESEPASSLLERLSEKEIADVIFHYGEERFSRRIARRIVEARERAALQTTEQLAELVRGCVPFAPRHRGKSIDPATRVFQALRIAVNDELAALKKLLSSLPGCVRPGGRVVIISYHSLEDRLVKHAFRNREIWEVLTRKPVRASEEEIATNPRSRSAKLRAARRR
jgi:16S rRNA (cytosine1402-N4)-methyltransferase